MKGMLCFKQKGAAVCAATLLQAWSTQLWIDTASTSVQVQGRTTPALQMTMSSRCFCCIRLCDRVCTEDRSARSSGSTDTDPCMPGAKLHVGGCHSAYGKGTLHLDSSCFYLICHLLPCLQRPVADT